MEDLAPRFAALDLAEVLGCPALPEPPPARGIVAERDDHGGLRLRSLDDRTLGTFALDYAGSAFRRRLAEGRKGLLGRAVGLAREPAARTTRVWDATAGFARDALWIAHAGARVVAFERDPWARALVESALARAIAAGDDLIRAAAERLELRAGDAREALRAAADLPAAERPQAILLDPMFPDKRGTALAKKEAQWLQALIGEGGDAEEDADLFAAARAAAPERIVVKRPRHARTIVPSPEPHHRFEGKSVRYDLYL